MINDELAISPEEITKRNISLRAVKTIIIFHPFPRQVLTFLAQFIPEPSKFFFLFQKSFARFNPFFWGDYGIGCSHLEPTYEKSEKGTDIFSIGIGPAEHFNNYNEHRGFDDAANEWEKGLEPFFWTPASSRTDRNDKNSPSPILSKSCGFFCFRANRLMFRENLTGILVLSVCLSWSPLTVPDVFPESCPGGDLGDECSLAEMDGSDVIIDNTRFQDITAPLGDRDAGYEISSRIRLVPVGVGTDRPGLRFEVVDGAMDNNPCVNLTDPVALNNVSYFVRGIDATPGAWVADQVRLTGSGTAISADSEYSLTLAENFTGQASTFPDSPLPIVFDIPFLANLAVETGASTRNFYVNPIPCGTAASIEFFEQRVRLTSGAPPAPAFLINAGINDSWFNPSTPGQGFFLTVFEDIGMIFLAWFTYDTERPPPEVDADLGDAGHRWLTAFGAYEGNSASLDIELTSGGVFNSPEPMPVQGTDGSITVEFGGCNSGLVSYVIESADVQGEIPIERIALDNVAACEELQTSAAQSNE